MMSILSLMGSDVMSSIINAIITWFNNILLDILLWLKEIFDIAYVLVRKLAGIDTYYYNGQLMGTGAADSKTVTGDIIEVLIRSDIVKNLFITLLVLGAILLLIVTFVAIWKTEWNFGKGANSKGAIISAALKALFNFIAVPVITFFGIFVGNALLRAIDDATAGGENVKMSDIVLTSIATNALRSDHLGVSENYNFVSKNNSVNAETGKAGIYQYFMNAKGEIVAEDILSAFKNNSTIKSKGVYYIDTTDTNIDALGVNQKLENGTLVFSFEDKQLVKVFFDITKFNYVLGYIVMIIMLKTMLTITFGLAKRIFNLLFLFIISPPIVAMTPINSEILSKWRGTFIKNACAGFITLGIYNIFMSIYPLFDRISLYGSSDKMFGWIPLSTLNGFVSLLFVCVGLNIINDISKTISGLFGVNDLFTDSTDKDGNSLFGSAFGTAGKAFKPLTIAPGAAGGLTRFFTKAKYQGMGSAFKDVGAGLKKGVNAGPLGDLWKGADLNKKGALKGFDEASKIAKEGKEKKQKENENKNGENNAAENKNGENVSMDKKNSSGENKSGESGSIYDKIGEYDPNKNIDAMEKRDAEDEYEKWQSRVDSTKKELEDAQKYLEDHKELGDEINKNDALKNLTTRAEVAQALGFHKEGEAFDFDKLTKEQQEKVQSIRDYNYEHNRALTRERQLDEESEQAEMRKNAYKKKYGEDVDDVLKKKNEEKNAENLDKPNSEDGD